MNDNEWTWNAAREANILPKEWLDLREANLDFSAYVDRVGRSKFETRIARERRSR